MSKIVRLLALGLALTVSLAGVSACQAPDPVSAQQTTGGSAPDTLTSPGGTNGGTFNGTNGGSQGSEDPALSAPTLPAGSAGSVEGTTPTPSSVDANGTTLTTDPGAEGTTPEETTSAEVTSPGETTADEASTPAVSANQPPESAAKDPAYFKDALFIGDSRTQGLMLYGTLYDATFIYNKGYNVGQYFDEVVNTGTSKMTGAAYVQSQSGNFNDVYLGFGINETGWPLGNFISYYRSVVQHVKSYHAGASIYVMAILPVEASQDGNTYLNNKVIKTFNEAIAKMTVEEGVYFLDATPAVAGPDGAIPAGSTPDGVHFDRDYVEKWQAYIQTHVAPR